MSIIGRKVKFHVEDDVDDGQIIDKVRIYSSQGGNRTAYLIETDEGMFEVVKPGDLISAVGGNNAGDD